MSELEVQIALARHLGSAVQHSLSLGRFPLVLAGNCLSALGVVSGLGAAGTSVLWFDAHGDFHTPETSESGFLDGMATAMLTGRCGTGATAQIPGFTPVRESDVLLLGAYDLDADEADALSASEVVVIHPEELAGLDAALAQLPARHACYLHLDLDILDAERVGRANAYAAPGGLSVAEAVDAIRRIGGVFPLRACTISAYDPDLDVRGTVAEAAFACAAAVLDCLP